MEIQLSLCSSARPGPGAPRFSTSTQRGRFLGRVATAPHKNDVITISVDFAEFVDDDRLLAVLGEFLISTEPMVSRLTYVFTPSGAEDDEAIKESDYEFFIYGSDKPEMRIGTEFRRRLPLDLLPALRDAEGDLANWRRSPQRPLLDEASSRIDRGDLESTAENISEATEVLTDTTEVSRACQ